MIVLASTSLACLQELLLLACAARLLVERLCADRLRLWHLQSGRVRHLHELSRWQLLVSYVRYCCVLQLIASSVPTARG